MSNPISIVDLSEAQKQKKRLPKSFATLGKWIDQIQEGDLPALAVKDNPRFLAFLKGVCHHLPDQESIDAGTHNPKGFYPEDCSVWMNSPLADYAEESDPVLNMNPPSESDYYGMALNVIVHEASKQGLTVWLDDLGLGFLPDHHIVVAKTQNPYMAEELLTMYDSPDLPDAQEQAQARKQSGQLSLKEATHRIKAWLQPHVPALGFETLKEDVGRDYRRLNYQRPIEGGLQRLEITVKNEKREALLHK